MKKFLSVVVGMVCCFALSAAENGNDPLNAVVKIEVTSTVPNFWLPWQSQLPSSSSGSGAVIRGGMILTNAHNVADSSLITVRKQNDALFVALLYLLSSSGPHLQHGLLWLQVMRVTISDAMEAFSLSYQVLGCH